MRPHYIFVFKVYHSSEVIVYFIKWKMEEKWLDGNSDYKNIYNIIRWHHCIIN